MIFHRVRFRGFASIRQFRTRNPRPHVVDAGCRGQVEIAPVLAPEDHVGRKLGHGLVQQEFSLRADHEQSGRFTLAGRAVDVAFDVQPHAVDAAVRREIINDAVRGQGAGFIDLVAVKLLGAAIGNVDRLAIGRDDDAVGFLQVIEQPFDRAVGIDPINAARGL